MTDTTLFRGFLFFSLLVAGALAAIICFTMAFNIMTQVPEKPDPRFMMECVYEWEQTPENCKDILRGEDPPPLPKYMEGC